MSDWGGVYEMIFDKHYVFPGHKHKYLAMNYRLKPTSKLPRLIDPILVYNGKHLSVIVKITTKYRRKFVDMTSVQYWM